MKSHQRQVETIFEIARGLAGAAERGAYVDTACAGDVTLRREVDSLLAAHDRSGSFLKTTVAMRLPQSPQDIGEPRFGDYELLEEIARGGMGVVYRARQLSLNRVVAIKMILSGQLASEAEVQRFRSEAQAVASLSHRNIVGIYEVGEHQGQPYFAMPFLEGSTLAQQVESGQWQPGDGTEAARVMARVARAVQYAHDSGILHRDLKPGNILIDAESEPCITDFGIAKQVKGKANLTVTGQVLGTPGFMAPEQARGKSDLSSPAVDIYSLGAVLYYLLTGRPPFVAESALDALLLVLEGEAVLPRRINPQVSAPLEQICMRCLEKRPEDRYASAGEVATDLEQFLKGEPLTARPKSIVRLFEVWTKRRPALAARICTVLVCVGILLVSWRHYNTTRLAELAVLASWLVISFLCQRGVDSRRHATWVRYVWSGADPVVLTAILLIADGFRGPLVMLYPTVIAVSGFWLRVPLVTVTTLVSLLGYGVLLLEARPLPTGSVPFRWHLLAVVAMIVTGLTVAYLVNRVRALRRFYEPRPPAGR